MRRTSQATTGGRDCTSAPLESARGGIVARTGTYSKSAVFVLRAFSDTNLDRPVLKERLSATGAFVG